MSDRADHLIERAAAKLREANAAAVGAPMAAPRPDIRQELRPDLRPETLGLRPQSPADAAADSSTVSQPPAFQPFVLAPIARNTSDLPPDSEKPVPTTPVPQRAQPVLDGMPGPIPAPAPPLTRPILAPVPPSLTLQTASARPSKAPALARTNPLPRGNAPGLALQAPPIIQLDALERAGMVVARTTRTRISEEYRIAIGRILRTLHEATEVQGARNVLMVTSARPGEGKSFTALNLAGSIAQNGTDAVLLVDVDPKAKPLSDQLGLGEAQGFLDLVSDPALRPEDLLRVTAIPNMAIMPVGTRVGGAAQAVGGSASMRPIIPTITRLARRFPKHLIMLDAPPCLSTSDPHMLAPHVGQIVLVVEAERTQRSEVEAAIDLIRVCPSITMLLNKVRMTTSHTFGAYDYFGSYT